MGESLPNNLEVHPKKSEDKNKNKNKNKNKTKKKRCHHCNHKLGLISFTCQCGHIFCVAHQSYHAHNCSYNRKAETQQTIKDKNPSVKPTTLEKM